MLVIFIEHLCHHLDAHGVALKIVLKNFVLMQKVFLAFLSSIPKSLLIFQLRKKANFG